jgi:hypothetical protein
MAITVQQIHPVAHLPLVLGVLRRLEVATLIDGLIPPHPAPTLTPARYMNRRMADKIMTCGILASRACM